MKILSQGNSAPEQDIWCNYCHAHFIFAKSDVRVETERHYTYDDIKDDYYHDFKNYYVYCPCCGHKQDVSAWAEDWFQR